MKVLKVIWLISAVLLLQAQGGSSRQPNNAERVRSVQSGEIKLEEKKKADPHEISQQAAKEYLNRLESTLRSNSSGSTNKPPELDDAAAAYLTVAYLYCSVHQGVCKYFLDALLEADVVQGRINKKDSCPTLRAFWKKYLENDLEARHKYATKIGFLAETGEFNTKERPKYIKCATTVKNERQGDMSDSEFFKQRYSNPEKMEALQKTMDFIKFAEDKKLNFFLEVRAMR